MLDGVFNHVGRGFWAFRDVLEKRERSPYRDWFRIDFGGDTGYHDGLWYESWEGHYELVKLNLGNPDVVRHQFDAIRSWVDRFGIDGAAAGRGLLPEPRLPAPAPGPSPRA